MAERRDSQPGHDSEGFEDDLLDDFAPTRVSRSPREELDSEPGVRAELVRVGELLAGKYRVERVHKRGALCITVEALHTQLGQRVVVRLLAADPRAYPEAAARFLRGARLAVRFQNEHTARVLDLGTLSSGAPFVVTELLAGSDLQRVLRVRELLTIAEAVDYLLQACEALSLAHAHGVVHRNLKPTNFFLTRKDDARRLVVLDFGVSEDPLSDAAINLGGISGAAKSLAYLAPEQIRDPSSVDARADIWALGAILHEMLTGYPLYDSSSTPALLAMIAADAPVPASHLRAEVPAELESIVLRCLAKERDERFPSVAALASALNPFASTIGHDSAARVSRTLGQRPRSSLPPPLPGQSRAIVRVPPPPKRIPPPVVPPAHPGRRFGELALTALGLAAASALGVYVAIHAMEGALAAAVKPRAVVADLSPALPASAPAMGAASAPITASTPIAALPTAAQVATPVTKPTATSVASPPQPAPVTAPMPVAVRAPAAPARRAAPKAALDGAAALADAKPVPVKGTSGQGLFDDAN